MSPTEAKPVEGEHTLQGVLTCPPNAVVGPVHPKAMTAVLTTPEEWDVWLLAPWSDAGALRRPLPDEALRIVAMGGREDPPPVREGLLL